MTSSNKNYKKRFNIIVATVVILISCGFIDYALGIANPAAVYCEKLGYEYIIKETVDGQQGFCQFPNGTIVDGWEFFTGEKGQEYNYCQKNGYEMKIIVSEECQYASKCVVCVLEDGTEVKATELVGIDSKSTLSPWDPVEPINNATTTPEHKTNYAFYFLGVAILIILSIVFFIVYRKIKKGNSYYE